MSDTPREPGGTLGGLESLGSFDSLLGHVASAPPLAVDAPGVLAPGTRLGRFEVIALIGKGGFGRVYEARDAELGRRVALKVLRPRRSGRRDEDVLADLRREAHAAARLRHPAVVTLHDLGSVDGTPYLVFELLEGETLAARLIRGALPAAEALAVAAEVARALVHAHAAGVVHGDLKPANVFLTHDGGVKTLDFGIARLRDALDGSPGVAGAGTPGFMAPEQRTGVADERSDLYALGRVLAACVEAPPAGIAELVARLTAVDPAARPASASVTLDALLAVERGLAGRAPDAAPYRYLDSFTEGEAGWFFGRRPEATRLVNRLAGRALVALVGPSGAGKSSLVAAGLLPRVRAQARRWTIVTMRPGTAPLATLAARLREACSEAAATVLGDADLAAKPGLAGETLRRHASLGGGAALLVVDQLEELYAQCGDAERAAMAAAILACGDDVLAPVRVVVTLRDDFLGRVAESPRLAEAVAAGLVILDRPGPEALVEALEEPARRAGYELEDGLAAEIVAGLAGETAPLPLLQLAASRLWEQRDEARRVLPRAALADAGGVAGLLATHANQVLASLPEATARRLLLGTVTAARTRKLVPRRDLLARGGDGADRVLERLVTSRLLVSSRLDDEERVELAHESLLARWDTLRRWLDEDEGDLRVADELARAAAYWIAEGRPRGLLYGGRRLSEALAWRARRGGAVPAAEQDFLAAAEQRARRARRLRVAALAGTALLLVAGALAGGVLAGRYKAEARAARLRALVTRAGAAADPLVGSLLLLEIAAEGRAPGAVQVARDLATREVPAWAASGHRAEVRWVGFDPGGTRLASLSSDGALLVWRAAGGPPAVADAGKDALSVVWAPDGTTLAVGGRNGLVAIVDPAGASPPRRVGEHSTGVMSMAFSPDGRRLVAGGDDKDALVLSVDGTAPPRRLVGHTRAGVVVAWSPDGKVIATAGVDRTVRLWPADGDAAPRVYGGFDDMVMDVAFSADSRRVSSASTDGTLRIFAVDGATPPVVLRGHQGWANGGAFTPDGTRVVSSSIDGTVRVWRADGEDAPVVLRAPQGAWAMAEPSPDGKHIIGMAAGEIHIWAVDGVGQARVLAAAGGAFGVSPDGKLIASGDADGTVRLWRLDGARDPIEHAGHRRAMPTILPLADGRVVTAGYDGAVRLWRADASLARGWDFPTEVNTALLEPGEHAFLAALEDGAILHVPLDGEPRERWRAGRGVVALALSPDGQTVGWCSTSGDVGVAPLGGGARLVTRRHLSACQGGLFGPDGAWITAGFDGVIRELHAGRPEIVRLQDSVIGPIVPLDAAHFATGGDRGIKIWPYAGGAPAYVEVGEPVYGLFASPDGQRLAALMQGRARVFRLDGAAPPFDLPGVEISMAFDARGERLAYARGDGGVVVMPAGGGEPLLLAGPRRVAQGLRFSPDGARVWTGASDGIFRVWLYRWEDLVGFLRARSRACLTAAQRAELLDETRAAAEAGAAACAAALYR